MRRYPLPRLFSRAWESGDGRWDFGFSKIAYARGGFHEPWGQEWSDGGEAIYCQGGEEVEWDRASEVEGASGGEVGRLRAG